MEQITHPATNPYQEIENELQENLKLCLEGNRSSMLASIVIKTISNKLKIIRLQQKEMRPVLHLVKK